MRYRKYEKLIIVGNFYTICSGSRRLLCITFMNLSLWKYILATIKCCFSGFNNVKHILQSYALPIFLEKSQVIVTKRQLLYYVISIKFRLLYAHNPSTALRHAIRHVKTNMKYQCVCHKEYKLVVAKYFIPAVFVS